MELNQIKIIFDSIINGIYSLGNKEIIFRQLDLLTFIVSLSIKEVSLGINDITESKDLICSSMNCWLSLDIEKIKSSLISKSYNDDLYIISVSWLKTMDLNDDIEIKEYNYENVFGIERKIVIIEMGYPRFLVEINHLFKYRSDLEKNENKYIGINPIIMFKGLNWGNIVHIFKLHNINLHGGSISRRHKLSIAEYRLGKFIELLDLFEYGKDEYYVMYSEKYFSSSKYTGPKFLDKNVKLRINPYIQEYIIINEYLKLQFENINLTKEVDLLEKEQNNININLGGGLIKILFYLVFFKL